MNRKILIGGAWPYANGPLHIGHLAGLLPGDVLARYHRAAGDEVYYVSGSDCYGTPVAIRARREGVRPEEISGRYHREFEECFKSLGFSYDVYGSTLEPEHHEFVKEFHQRLYRSPYVYEKEAPQAWCGRCGQFLADRFVEGNCPKCGERARGDQCDLCGAVLEPEQLLEPKCAICGNTPEFRGSRHLYIALGKLQQQLEKWVESHGEDWRRNALAFTSRYLSEGLRDRALTRDLDWGVEVPREGYEDKRIYIWAENVLGYLSMSAVAARERGTSFEELWQDGGKSRVKHYYVHAKDNIPFHTIILPALLLAEGSGFHLPDAIISNEYMTLEGRKISTSRGHAVWVKELLDVCRPDAVRYFFLANGPEKRDTDFTWEEFVRKNNGELLGAYGNLVNRTLVFIRKYLGGRVPEGQLPPSVQGQLPVWYSKTARLIEGGKFKDALDYLFAAVREANRYFDSKEPWRTRTENPLSCRNTLYACVQWIANLAVLFFPFLPFSSTKIIEWLGIDNSWNVKSIPAGKVLPEPELLFERYAPCANGIQLIKH